jgi:two-component system sensor histidine kinase RpfC
MNWLSCPRVLFERLRGRADSEHEQAIIRLGVGLIASAYLLTRAARPGDLAWEILIPAIVYAFMAAAALIFIDIIARPGVAPFRRVCAMVLDLGTTTALMALGGVGGIPLFAVYLWVTLGNGFRYGQPYLAASAILSVAGFGAVLGISDFWGQHQELSAGVLVVLLAIPAYAATLIQKLNDAVRRAQDASRAKSQFLARMSHELRTPLNGVIGMTDILLDSEIATEAQGIARSIQSSASALLDVIEKVLDFSKIEAGRIEIECTEFDVHRLSADTIQIFKSMAERKGVRVRLRIDPLVPPMVVGDPAHVRQVLTNLLGNAVKFTQAGWVDVRIKPARNTFRNSAYGLRFEVEDTGIGIAPENQDRIFESFQQEDSSTTRRFGGTGLGTAIAKELVNLMGGKIGLRSQVGAGTLFWFELPFSVSQSLATPPVGFQQEHVLVIGKSDAAAAICSQLASWGASAAAVASGEIAAAEVRASLARPRPVTIVMVMAGALDLDPAQIAATLLAALGPDCPRLVLLNENETIHDARTRHDHGYSAVLSDPLTHSQFYNLVLARQRERQLPDNVISISDHYRRIARHSDQELHVLIAEDNETNRQVLEAILQRVGHKVTAVDDGEQALDALENHEDSIDLMILDMNMPNRGGLEVFQAHRFMRPIPTIILTADATQDALNRCRESGVDAYLTKPIDTRRLLTTIVRLSERSARRDPITRRGDAKRTTPPAQRTQPLLDEGKLRELFSLGFDRAFFDELISGFLRDGEDSLSQLGSALDDRDYLRLRSAIHALQGSAGELGALRVVALCNELKGLKPFELGSPRSRQLLEESRKALASTGTTLSEFAHTQCGVVT